MSTVVPVKARAAWGRNQTSNASCTIESALRTRLNNCPSHLADNKLVPWKSSEFGVNDFLEYGLGTFMYFKLLIKLCIFLIFCSMCVLPAMYYYQQSDANEMVCMYKSNPL